MLPLLIITISAFAITSADPRPESNPQDPQDPNYYYTEYGEEYGDYYSNYKDNYEEVYNYEDGNERKSILNSINFLLIFLTFSAGPSRGDQSLVSPPATPAPPPPTTTTEGRIIFCFFSLFSLCFLGMLWLYFPLYPSPFLSLTFPALHQKGLPSFGNISISIPNCRVIGSNHLQKPARILLGH